MGTGRGDGLPVPPPPPIRTSRWRLPPPPRLRHHPALPRPVNAAGGPGERGGERAWRERCVCSPPATQPPAGDASWRRRRDSHRPPPHSRGGALGSGAGHLVAIPPHEQNPPQSPWQPAARQPPAGGSADRRRGRRPRRSRRGAPRRRAVASIGYWPDAAPTGRARRHHRLRSPAATHRVRHHPDARAVAKRQAAAAVVVVAVPAYLRACALRLLPARPRRPASLWTRARGLVAPPPRWRPGYVWPPP